MTKPNTNTTKIIQNIITQRGMINITWQELTSTPILAIPTETIQPRNNYKPTKILLYYYVDFIIEFNLIQFNLILNYILSSISLLDITHLSGRDKQYINIIIH